MVLLIHNMKKIVIFIIINFKLFILSQFKFILNNGRKITFVMKLLDNYKIWRGKGLIRPTCSAPLTGSLFSE